MHIVSFTKRTIRRTQRHCTVTNRAELTRTHSFNAIIEEPVKSYLCTADLKASVQTSFAANVVKITSRDQTSLVSVLLCFGATMTPNRSWSYYFPGMVPVTAPIA
ncbi:hypothetical protein APHAL10511_002374 [Amanita phalloides]|nr:hypothetical protein APHAL10511_002374 [Amanita phalloides]